MRRVRKHTTSAPSVSGRQADRFDTELPVEVNGAQGLTRNISASGVYFETDVLQAPGTRVSFTVEMHVNGKKMNMVCEGEIVRVEQRNGKIGVAAQLVNSFFSGADELIDAQKLTMVAESTRTPTRR